MGNLNKKAQPLLGEAGPFYLIYLFYFCGEILNMLFARRDFFLAAAFFLIVLPFAALSIAL